MATLSENLAETSFVQAQGQWRNSFEADLRSEWGWLSITALEWLEADEVHVPGLGWFLPESDAVLFRGEGGVTLEGEPVQERRFVLPLEGASGRLLAGDVSVVLLRRAGRYGVRVYDRTAPSWAGFAGLSWFAPDPAYRVTGTFVPYAAPRSVEVMTVIGSSYEALIPGEVRFTLHGVACRLLPTVAGEKLFFSFRDETGGRVTYPPGRFLVADAPNGGEVVLDFNRAYNPPCSRTPFATCPLPLPENRLGVAVAAGERYEGA